MGRIFNLKQGLVGLAILVSIGAGYFAGINSNSNRSYVRGFDDGSCVQRIVVRREALKEACDLMNWAVHERNYEFDYSDPKAIKLGKLSEEDIVNCSASYRNAINEIERAGNEESRSLEGRARAMRDFGMRK